MLKKKLFGKNIKPSCTYCLNSVYENDTCHCIKNKTIIDDKCKSFKYDPLMQCSAVSADSFTSTP